MTDQARIRAEAERLLEVFTAKGASRIEADILQPAEIMLDLYGEDIRARAYVTSDPVRGEVMLRPDFTLPVAQMHMSGTGGAARYSYVGPVFRRQERPDGRPSEYIQVGYEVFDAGNENEAEADVFSTFYQELAVAPVRGILGDIGILVAAVQGLNTTDDRRAALMRHIWRPARFRALLERFAAPLAPRATPPGGPEIGLRSAAEVAAREAALARDAEAPVLPPEDLTRLEALLAVAGPAPEAMARLERMAADLPAIAPSVERLRHRFSAIAARGIALDTLEFEVSYGRTSMEYYNGFVFGFAAPGLPPVATGGRYDALTEALGSGQAEPAVGGVIRPDLLLEVRDA